MLASHSSGRSVVVAVIEAGGDVVVVENAVGVAVGHADAADPGAPGAVVGVLVVRPERSGLIGLLIDAGVITPAVGVFG